MHRFFSASLWFSTGIMVSVAVCELYDRYLIYSEECGAAAKAEHLADDKALAEAENRACIEVRNDISQNSVIANYQEQITADDERNPVRERRIPLVLTYWMDLFTTLGHRLMTTEPGDPAFDTLVQDIDRQLDTLALTVKRTDELAHYYIGLIATGRERKAKQYMQVVFELQDQAAQFKITQKAFGFLAVKIKEKITNAGGREANCGAVTEYVAD